MGTLIQGIAALIALCLIFVPATLILFSSVRYTRVMRMGPSWAIFAGALLLTLLSLDVLYPLILTLALELNAEQLASVSIFLAYAKPVASYVALLLIGIGMMLHSRSISRLQSESSRDAHASEKS